MKSLNIKKIEVLTLGSDPEFFLQNEDGTPAILIGKIGGSKEEPLDIGNGLSIQEDGVSMEFCIPPCSTKKEWLIHLNACKEQGDMIAKNNDAKLVTQSSQIFDKKELKKHPKAMEFGCSQSFNGWTYGTTRVPPADTVGGLRTTGFHVHFGISNMEMPNGTAIDTCAYLARICDICLGVPSVLLDDDTTRRKIYGEPADFRYKNIKNNVMLFEYRCLGGGLLKDDETIGWVYDNAYLAVEMFNKLVEDPTLCEIIDACEEEIYEAMKHSHKDLAIFIVNKFNIPIPLKTLSTIKIEQEQNG